MHFSNASDKEYGSSEALTNPSDGDDDDDDDSQENSGEKTDLDTNDAIVSDDNEVSEENG